MKTWKKLPPQIKALMIQRRFEQKGKRNKKPFKKKGLDAGFVFSQTTEGDVFWNNVICGDFKLFFERYPKKQMHELCQIGKLFEQFGKDLQNFKP
jgi:hypothetical protein